MGAASIHHLCKSIVIENTRAHPSCEGLGSKTLPASRDAACMCRCCMQTEAHTCQQLLHASSVQQATSAPRVAAALRAPCGPACTLLSMRQGLLLQ